MRRNPIYVFDNLDSIGINKVPLESMILINDDGEGNSISIKLEAKSDIGPSTTIRDFLRKTDNYTTPGSANFISSKNIGEPGGIVPLDENGMISDKYIPNMYITDVSVVNSEQEMVDLQARVGELAIRIDNGKNFIRSSIENDDATDWTEIQSGCTTVQSINGLTGNVNITADDIPEGISHNYFTTEKFLEEANGTSITEFVDVNMSAEPQSGDALIYTGRYYTPATIPYPITSVNGKTGDAILRTDDLSDLGQGNKFYDDAFVDARVQELIDDDASFGDRDVLWSADKMAQELSYKATNDYVNHNFELKADKLNSELNGEVIVSQNGANRAELTIKRTSSNDSIKIEPEMISFIDENEVNSYIKTTDANIIVGIDGADSLLFIKEKAPESMFQPTEDNHLTTRLYVLDKIETELEAGLLLKYNQAGGVLDGEIVAPITTTKDPSSTRYLQLKEDPIDKKIGLYSKDNSSHVWSLLSDTEDNKLTLKSTNDFIIDIPSDKKAQLKKGDDVGLVVAVADPGASFIEGDQLSYNENLRMFEAVPIRFTDEEKDKLAGLPSDIPEATKETIDDLGIDAATVTGFTVGINVPQDAVFTDTVYDDTDIQERVQNIEEAQPVIRNKGKINFYGDGSKTEFLYEGSVLIEAETDVFLNGELVEDDDSVYSIDEAQNGEDTVLKFVNAPANGLWIRLNYFR